MFEAAQSRQRWLRRFPKGSGIFDRPWLEGVEPFVLGALVAAVGTLIAVLFYFWEKYLAAVAASAVTVAVRLVLRFMLR